MSQPQPVGVNVLLGTVISTGVTLAALVWPGLTVALQVAIVGFANSVVALGVWYLTQRQVTPTSSPRLEVGTSVEALQGGKPTGQATTVRLDHNLPPVSTSSW